MAESTKTLGELTMPRWFNGDGSGILKWRYGNVPYVWSYYFVEISPYIGLTYGRYLESIGS